MKIAVLSWLAWKIYVIKMTQWLHVDADPSSYSISWNHALNHYIISHKIAPNEHFSWNKAESVAWLSFVTREMLISGCFLENDICCLNIVLCNFVGPVPKYNLFKHVNFINFQIKEWSYDYLLYFKYENVPQYQPPTVSTERHFHVFLPVIWCV